MCPSCESEGIFAALLLVTIIVIIAVFYVNPGGKKDSFCGPTQQDYRDIGCNNVLLPIIDRVSDQDIIDKSPPCKLVASDKGMILKPSAAILKEQDYYEFGCNQVNLNNLLNATKTPNVHNPDVNTPDVHNPGAPPLNSFQLLSETNDSSLLMPGEGGLSDYLGVPCSFIPSDLPLRISDDIDYYHHGNAHIKDSAMLDNYYEPDHYPLTG